MQDQDAISRMKQGDPHGLEVLVGRYQEKAIYAAYAVLHDRSLAEEVVQEAFLRAYEKSRQFKDGRPFAPWFFRIVVNQAVKIARQQQRWASLEEEPDEETRRLAGWMVTGIADSRQQPEELLMLAQREDVVWNALRQLSPEQRAAVVMRYYLEMSAAEMAEELGKPVSTVKWWLRAARKRLGALLKPIYKP